jgi:hypothetical protein
VVLAESLWKLLLSDIYTGAPLLHNLLASFIHARVDLSNSILSLFARHIFLYLTQEEHLALLHIFLQHLLKPGVILVATWSRLLERVGVQEDLMVLRSWFSTLPIHFFHCNCEN